MHGGFFHHYCGGHFCVILAILSLSLDLSCGKVQFTIGSTSNLLDFMSVNTILGVVRNGTISFDPTLFGELPGVWPEPCHFLKQGDTIIVCFKTRL